MLDRLISWLYITRIWGPRCHDFDDGCSICQQWKFHDDIFGGDDDV